MDVSEATLQELFTLIRQNNEKTNEVDKKVTELVAKTSEKDRACEKHDKTTENHENRIYGLELWRAAQGGITGFLWRVFPLLLSAISVALAAYAVTHGGHG
ncbi:hypothetical protein Ga0466249_002820 [Sporomusaceae bacterium BoRhaA]|uniref:hypothetical protein n=1 Tax=Pelorhabdus rhamnosifermentans TaxID=2772457 RepID=UPI001C06294D|nr:hypothetical protein [Pelorhabdus rhamnosifermentans]MBU2701701.1 hypothetical protein [Pelorhabdus rhamnosifermentans]